MHSQYDENVDLGNTRVELGATQCFSTNVFQPYTPGFSTLTTRYNRWARKCKTNQHHNH